MTVILIIPTASYKRRDGDRMTVDIQEYVGKKKGRKRQMIIDMPIYQEDLIAGLRRGWKATTAILQHTTFIEACEIEGGTLLVVR